MKNSGGISTSGSHRYRQSRIESDNHQNHHSKNANSNSMNKHHKETNTKSNTPTDETNQSKIKTSTENRTVMDPARPSISYWTKFFTEAGFSSSLSAEYSLIFAKHRIRSDMMNELNKEILSEMGIKAMGDIIAIVRQAKNQANLDEVSRGNAIVVANTVDKSSKAANINIDKPQQQISKSGDDNNNKSIVSRGFTVNQSAQRAANTTTDKQGYHNSLNQPGAKIKSRLSLTSGALKSSTVEKPHTSQSNTNNNDHQNNNDNNFKYSHNSNKRLSSSSKLSDSLAKRLCPELPNTEPKRRLGEEKTLVVHYPSPSAIARAHERMSGTNKLNSRGDTHVNSQKVGLTSAASSSIKSRLGQISLKTNKIHRR